MQSPRHPALQPPSDAQIVHGYPWKATAFHSNLWISIDVNGFPCISVHSIDYYRNQWIPWIAMEINGFQWVSIDFYRFPVISMEIHGIITTSLESMPAKQPPCHPAIHTYCPASSLGRTNNPRISMESNGFACKSMDIHRFQSLFIYFDKFQLISIEINRFPLMLM